MAGDMDDDARGTQGVSAGRDAFIAGRDMLVLEAPAQSLLPLSAAVRNPGPVFAAARIEEFTGRMWLSAQADDFMARHPRGYIFVEAEAGVGKTAFAAWLVKTRDYLSHFSSYSMGNTARAAATNLSAQLITRFGLREHAPGGTLPEWARAPDGLEQLLNAASTRAEREQRGPVVLVVDGLDEADPVDREYAWGCPRCCQTASSSSLPTGPAVSPGAPTRRTSPCRSPRMTTATATT